MIFLSEPQLFQCDLSLRTAAFSGEYSFSLNSADLYDNDATTRTSRTFGGTMTMWRKELDAHVSVHPVSTPAFLPIILTLPGVAVSIHICIYLPTQGKEDRFMEDISSLESCISEMKIQYPDALFYLRGDFNTSEKNIKRLGVLDYFCDSNYLTSVPVSHTTYHHFLGDGLSDSHLDKLLYSHTRNTSEKLVTIVCKLSNPLVNSHHDILVSSVNIPHVIHAPADSSKNVTAPRLVNTRNKIMWSDSGSSKYREIVTRNLQHIQELWLNTPTTVSIQIALQATNSIMDRAECLTNKSIQLDKPYIPRSAAVPREIKLSQRVLLKKYRHLRYFVGPPEHRDLLRNEYSKAKKEHRKLERKYSAMNSSKRDHFLFSALSSDPRALFKSIKSSKSCSTKVHTLHVGDKTYLGGNVQDGFYDSISRLKSLDENQSSSTNDFFLDYQYIMNICSNATLPQISYKKSTDILHKIRACVSDLFSITAYHYLHAGPVGLLHFHLLLSSLIRDINTVSLTEVSTVYAVVLFKGHGRDRSSDRSYRTISTCPLVAKALDLYLRDLNLEAWNSDLSEVQFMGEGSSHELAAVLFTECIQYSMYTAKKPLYALYLDAKSAFDNVLYQHLIRNLYLCGTTPASLMYINSRLFNRKTILDWDRQHMGPIHDEKGVEQGGPNSGDYYKVFGKPQLDLAQKSCLGVTLPGNITVSAIGQADDTILLSDNLNALQNLLELTMNFCLKYDVRLCAEKTKLQAFSPSCQLLTAEHSMNISPVNMDGNKLKFVTNSMQGAEHVGIVRSANGNLPHILSRFTAHQNSMAAVMHTGMGRHHRGNPAASLRIQHVYGTPVLLSGVGSLVLSKEEIKMIDNHLNSTLQNMMRLHVRTPHCVTAFLAGCLPGTALVHLRILSNFGMVTRNPDSILYKLGLEIFSHNKPSSKSWFSKVRGICLLYQLPHPIVLMKKSMTKLTLKR